MTSADDLVSDLRSQRRPYVTATVVRAERPTSAKPGDSAVVLEDGTMVGFVGGECVRTSVVRQALEALRTAQPVLLRVSPEAGGAGGAGAGAGGVGGAGGADAGIADPRLAPAGQPGLVSVHNPCLSGGTLEVFLQPFVPPALVVVHGDAPVARSLRSLAAWLGYQAEAFEGEVPPGAAAVIVASHGSGEATLLRCALHSEVPYIGLIASPRRGASVLAGLGLGSDEMQRIHTPAGLDIGARSPEEVALSVMAEMVSLRPKIPSPAAATPAAATPAAATPAAGGAATTTPAASITSTPNRPPVPMPLGEATDPVCGMAVATVPSSRHLDHDGQLYWFCGSGCEEAFRADPSAFPRS